MFFLTCSKVSPQEQSEVGETLPLVHRTSPIWRTQSPGGASGTGLSAIFATTEVGAQDMSDEWPQK